MSKNEDKSTVLLKHHLKALKMPTILAECEKVAARCAQENVGHLGFLLQLCELELLELMRCEYIDKRENILLVGNSGTGKTHLATALAMEACSRGKRVRFFRVTELITQLMEAREERQLARMRTGLSKLDLLVLDELGYVPASKIGAELLFDVISTAYERTSLIVTTNLPFENWTEVLGSERLTGATLDRLTHRCHILETRGDSYRLREAKRRRGGKKDERLEGAQEGGEDGHD